jgi:hypothetical protein
MGGGANRDCEDDYGIGMAFAGFGLAILIYGSPDANPIAKNWLLRHLFGAD